MVEFDIELTERDICDIIAKHYFVDAKNVTVKKYVEINGHDDVKFMIWIKK